MRPKIAPARPYFLPANCVYLDLQSSIFAKAARGCEAAKFTVGTSFSLEVEVDFRRTIKPAWRHRPDRIDFMACAKVTWPVWEDHRFPLRRLRLLSVEVKLYSGDLCRGSFLGGPKKCVAEFQIEKLLVPSPILRFLALVIYVVSIVVTC